MGGLRKYMPITAGTFIVGWLAIAGVIPFAGFWAKDEILAKAWFGHDYALWAVGVVAALLTAFYMTRQVWLVFYGTERWHDDVRARGRRRARTRARAREHASRTSRRGSCTIPLIVLAVFSIRRRAHRPAVRQPRSSTCSTAGSNRCCSARTSRSTSSFFDGVRCCRRSRSRSRSSASSSVARVYLQRPQRRRHRSRRSNASAASPTCSRTRTTSTIGLGRFGERPGHCVRELPHRRRRPQGHRRRGQRHRHACTRDGGGGLAPAANRTGAQLRARRSCSAPCSCSRTSRRG